MISSTLDSRNFAAGIAISKDLLPIMSIYSKIFLQKIKETMPIINNYYRLPSNHTD